MSARDEAARGEAATEDAATGDASKGDAATARGLWRNADFVRFWLGMNVSFLGAQLSSLAYPLTAVLVLHATPAQMGLLRATGTAAAFVVGPLAGVFVDRVRRRPLLVASDLGSALLAFSIPLAYALGALTLAQLYCVQMLAGALSIFAEVAGMSYLPALVRREQLVAANSRVQASSAVISIAGPSAAGLLVQALTAPVAVIFDAVSFVLSAVCTLLIRSPEPAHETNATDETTVTRAATELRAPAETRVATGTRDATEMNGATDTNGAGDASARRGLRAEIAEGLRFVYGDRLLRPLAEGIAFHFLFANVIYSLVVLYAVRELRVGPAPLGLVFAALGPGFLLGALLAPRAARRFGAGAVMTYAPLLSFAGMCLVPLATGPVARAVATLAAAHFLAACGIQLHGINLVAWRQAVTPPRLQGRMNASFRYVNLLGACLGSLAAGALAGRVGLRATLAVGACGMLVPFLRLFFSPVRTLRGAPAA